MLFDFLIDLFDPSKQRNLIDKQLLGCQEQGQIVERALPSLDPIDHQDIRDHPTANKENIPNNILSTEKKDKTLMEKILQSSSAKTFQNLRGLSYSKDD